MKTDMKNKITRTIHRAGLKLKKHSPEILVAAGTVGVVAGTVMACKATTKLSTILEESKEQIDQIHGYVEENGYSEKYNEQDEKKDLTIVYAQTGLKVAKLYAPAAAVMTVSLAAIVGSHKIMRKRNVALAAAYKAVDTGFKEYRGRVVERFGEDLDHELRYNIKAKEVEETIVDENGEEKTVTKTVNVVGSEPSVYARFFDCGCIGWENDPEQNLFIARSYQELANQILSSKGHLFLNEVYDMFGLPRSKAGQEVGWIYDPQKNVGDKKQVQFGIYNHNSEKARDFVNGYEATILLDFNVDGVILDEIEEHQRCFWG